MGLIRSIQSNKRRLRGGFNIIFANARRRFNNLQTTIDHIQNTKIGDDPVDDALAG